MTVVLAAIGAKALYLCYIWLLSAITASELSRSKGYGEYCPEDPGHNEEAWEKNRRVEFKIVKTKDGPTGVELGCDTAARKGAKPDAVPP